MTLAFYDPEHPYLIHPNNKHKVEDIIYSRFFEGKFIRLHQVVYQYTGKGYWKALPEEKVKKKIFDILKKLYTVDQEGNQVYRYCSDRHNKETYSYVSIGIVPSNDLEKQIEKKPPLLCFKNGTLNLETGEFREHRKEDYLTQYLPYSYHPNSTLGEDSTFLNFLKSSFGEEQIPLIRAITQMLINPACPYGKFPHVKGASGSGKGTLLEVWASLFPEEVTQEIANFSLLSNPDKVHQNLKNKKFVYCADASSYMSEPNTFYNLVQNDRVAGRALHSSETYTKRWNVRLAIASTNNLKIENAGAGWQRRCIPITTKGAVQQKDHYLWDQLKEEKSQIISWALSMSAEERDQLLFTTDVWAESTKDNLRDQEVHADPIAGFIDDCLLPSDEEDGSFDSEINFDKVYKAFRSYCEQSGIRPTSRQKFKNRIKERLPSDCWRKWSKKKVNGVTKHIPEEMIHVKWANPEMIRENDMSDQRFPVYVNTAEIVGGGLEAFDNWIHPDQRKGLKEGDDLSQILQPI